ncbi:PDC sensor domain-containing protein [Desulfatibacillum aliphaticivorans]|uniref:PDC sensor domain-containing protein n=1 Tax=Desulfatibacillum aliphaticivorans TaxID=218208 RepID=UPI000419895F|nr:cache domain-containing protein [Desulfatibacillum aliphaticivorans]
MKKVVIAVLLFGLLACPFAWASEDSAQTRPLENSLLNAFTNLLDLHISSITADLDMLAQTNQVRSGEWESMRPLITAYQEAHPHLVVVFIKPDGEYWTPEKGLVDKNLKDRDYFQPLMNGEKIFAHPLVSRSTGKKAVFCGAPVLDEDRVVGAVGVSIFLEDLSEIIKKSFDLPKGMHFFAMTPELNTVIHYMPQKIFANPEKQNEPTMAAAMKTVRKEAKGQVEYSWKGVPRTLIFQRSPITGWICCMVIVQP